LIFFLLKLTLNSMKHSLIFLVIGFFLAIILVGSYKFSSSRTIIINSQPTVIKPQPAEVIDINSSNNDIQKSLDEFRFNEALSRNNFSKVTSDIVLAEVLDSNNIFLEKNINKRVPIASLTKLMTAVIALDNIKSDTRITLSQQDISSFGDYGNFKAGETFLLKDLLNGMLISSSNDAATAIARQVGTRHFIALMNQKAQQLGMTQTVFVNPTGLSLNDKSTAFDLEKLVKYILDYHPKIFDVTKNYQIQIKELNSGKMKLISNNNQFSHNNNFLGGKTGSLLNINKGGLISLFRYKDYKILIIILNDDFYKRYTNTEEVLNNLPR